MDWIDGEELDRWVERRVLAGDPGGSASLRRLADDWAEMVRALQQAQVVAHDA